MPTIQILGATKINMYFRDHAPPHFHAIFGEKEELIGIDGLLSLRGKIPTAERKKVISWALANLAFIWAKWNEFNP